MENNKENIQQSKKLKGRRRLKRFGIWLLVDLVVAGTIILLLLHSPANFHQQKPIDTNELSPYLTNYLMPTIYSGAQKQQPFEMEVIAKGINDIIARNPWPIEADDIIFHMPQTFLSQDTITLIGAVVFKGAKLIITLQAKPTINEAGLLNFNVTGVRVGSLNITIIAKFIAGQMYRKRMGDYYIDSDDLNAKLAASLLNNTPFDPTFKIEDKYIRIIKVALTKGKLNINFVPAKK